MGLFELDEEGTVLYSSIESIGGYLYREPKLDGANFFDEIVPFINKGDFQRRFDLFRLAETRACTFGFNCEYPDGPFSVKVVMARLSVDRNRCSFLVHLRKPTL
jgi:hypothetical protein